MLRLRNIHKTYQLGRTSVPVLRGVDLDVARGELLVILGSSGSGKSTLLHLMGGLDRPDKAQATANGLAPSIEVDGVQLVGLSQRGLDLHRSRTVGFVFQFYHLLPELTVLENVMLAAMVDGGGPFAGDAQGRRERAMTLLHSVGLDHRLHHRPVELSGGERQRVAIARALINKPPVLLADEPTGNLDSATGAKVLDTLLALRRNHRQTMVIVTHDAATAARADRVVRLVDGCVMGEMSELAAVRAVAALPIPLDHDHVDAEPPAHQPVREPTQSSHALQAAPGETTTDATNATELLPPPAETTRTNGTLPLSASQGPEQILHAVRQALQRTD
jgi:lipoprotein-releasing system ATP-binding protein